jgi:amino acid permease
LINMDYDIIFHTLLYLFLLFSLGESGLSKALDYRGNAAYFKQQFKDTPFSGMSGLLLAFITLLELAVSVIALMAIVEAWADGGYSWGLLALSMGALNFMVLMLGLRLSRDYAGAAGVVPYLAVSLIGLGGLLYL